MRRAAGGSTVAGSLQPWVVDSSLPKGLLPVSESLEGRFQLGRSTFYGGLNRPRLVAVGYIIGPNTAIVVQVGGSYGMAVLLPLYQAMVPTPDALAGVATTKATWSGQIRYIGIGAMLVGVCGPSRSFAVQFCRACNS